MTMAPPAGAEFQVGVEPAAEIHKRRSFHSQSMRLKPSLNSNEMIKMVRLQPARIDQLTRLPFEIGLCDDAVKLCQPPSDRLGHTPVVALERPEPDGLVFLLK